MQQPRNVDGVGDHSEWSSLLSTSPPHSSPLINPTNDAASAALNSSPRYDTQFKSALSLTPAIDSNNANKSPLGGGQPGSGRAFDSSVAKEDTGASESSSYSNSDDSNSNPQPAQAATQPHSLSSSMISSAPLPTPPVGVGIAGFSPPLVKQLLAPSSTPADEDSNMFEMPVIIPDVSNHTNRLNTYQSQSVSHSKSRSGMHTRQTSAALRYKSDATPHDETTIELVPHPPESRTRKMSDKGLTSSSSPVPRQRAFASTHSLANSSPMPSPSPSPAAKSTPTDKSPSSRDDSSDDNSPEPLTMWEYVKKCCRRDPSKRCSFVTITVCLVVGQVVVSCILIWLLGYLSTLSTVSTLTATIRQSIMHDVNFELNIAMQQPLQAAYDIRHMTRLKFPDIADRKYIMNETGWLAELSYVCMRYPSLSRIGFATRNNIYVLITKGIQSSGEAQPIYSSDLNMTISVAEQEIDAHGNLVVTLENYRPTRIHPATSVAPFNLQPEILDTDTPDDIRRYLGVVVQPQANFSVIQRPFYTAAVDLASQGLAAGWSNVYSSSNVNMPGSYFLAIAAVNVDSLPDGTVGMAGFAVTNLDNLNALLKGLPLGKNGFGYFIRTNGRVASSSVPHINDLIKNSVSVNSTSLDISMFTSDDDWLQILTPVLLDWNLITVEPITPRNSSTIIPYRSQIYETSVTYSGKKYHIQASMLANQTSGLPISVVIVTKDEDFDADVRTNIINTVLLSILVAGVSVCVSTLVTNCISRPMMETVDYMERSCKIIEMERSEKQRKMLSTLCEEWSSASGMVLPPLLTSSAFVSMQIREDPRHRASGRFYCCGSCCDKQLGWLMCGGIGRSLREVQSMHRAFGSMLYSLASYDELEAINHAKRQFIRYIFHEVRVPFNAIVLGIEQLEMELRDLNGAAPDALSTVGIISEQSQVVSRILNDVLSMQKIEDGALSLEHDVFSMERMLKNALYAFHSPCMDKRIKIQSELDSIDELVALALPAFRIGQVIRSQTSKQFIVSAGGEPKSDQVDGVVEDRDSNTGEWPTHHSRHPSTASSIGHSELISALGGSRHHRSRGAYTHRAYVRGDPYRLRQVFSNLLSNAIKFSPNGSRIQVRMSASNFQVNPYAAQANATLLMREAQLNQTDVSNGRGSSVDLQAVTLPESLGTITVRVSVKDDGPGVPPSERQHMFQAYHQVAAGKMQKGNGSGLGLSISKSIVELHGGTIGFECGGDDEAASKLDARSKAAVNPLTPINDKGKEKERTKNKDKDKDQDSFKVDEDRPNRGAEFWFEIPLDVALVKSRSGSTHQHNSSMSNFAFSSADGNVTSTSSNQHLKPQSQQMSIPPHHQHTSSNVGTGGRAVNFSGEVTAIPQSDASGFHTVSFDDEIFHCSSEPILSPHVGLVHRTAPLSSREEKADATAATAAAAAASGRSNSSYGIGVDPSDTHLHSPRTLSPRIPGRAVGGRGSDKDHIFDIVPLNESGIGSDGENETSVSRIRFHDDGTFDENGVYMDPTRGDWDHVEEIVPKRRQKSPSPAPIKPTGREPVIVHASPPAHTQISTFVDSAIPSTASTSSAPATISGSSSTRSINAPSGNSMSPNVSPTSSLPPPGGAPNPSSISSSLHGLSANSVSSSPVAPRPLPPKLNLISTGSSNSVSSIQSQPPVSTAASAKAVDLASFISAETRAQHKANVAAGNQGPGWSNLTPVTTPAPSSRESGSSSPSTPFAGGYAASSTTTAAHSASKGSSSGVAPAPAPSHRQAKAGAGNLGFKPGLRVLVVEDSLPNRHLLVGLLTRLKCVAKGVEDGQYCVDLFENFMGNANSEVAGSTAAALSSPSAYPFDIILMDGSMPRKNGVVATQELRSHGINLPIVAITGNALSEDVEAFMLAGANSVLLKPVSVKELQAQLARWCPNSP